MRTWCVTKRWKCRLRRLRSEIAEILKREGFIRDAEYIEDNKQGIIRIFLKYGPNNERVITGLKRISKPGLRVYTKSDGNSARAGRTRHRDHLHFQRR